MDGGRNATSTNYRSRRLNSLIPTLTLIKYKSYQPTVGDDRLRGKLGFAEEYDSRGGRDEERHMVINNNGVIGKSLTRTHKYMH